MVPASGTLPVHGLTEDDGLLSHVLRLSTGEYRGLPKPPEWRAPPMQTRRVSGSGCIGTRV